VQGLQGEVHPPVCVPGVEGLGDRQRLRVLLRGARPVRGEGSGGGLDLRHRGVLGGELEVQEVPHGALGRHGQLLVDHGERAGAADGAGVREEGAREHLQQRGLAAAVLPHHAEAGGGGDREVEPVQDGAGAADQADPGGGQLGVLARGHGGTVDGNGGHASSGVRSRARPDGRGS
jgi:hypothetical protein